MSRKSSTADESSLELLLDTICNTFGGVLFIALLVIILLNTTSSDPTEGEEQEVSKVEILKEENRRQQLTSELERLQKIDANNQSVMGKLVSPELLKLAQETKRIQQQEGQLTRQKSNLIGENTQVHQETTQIDEDAQNRKDGIEAEKRRAAGLEKKKEEVVKQNTKEAVIPKETLADESWSPVTHFLKRKTLYWEFEVVPQGSDRHVVEKTSPAIQVSGPASKSALLNHFGKYRPRDHFIQLFAWEDSFESFETVREVLEERKLKYSLIPMKKDDPVVQMTRKSGPLKVQ